MDECCDKWFYDQGHSGIRSMQRFGDDMIAAAESEKQAKAFLEVLKERFLEYGLFVSEEKTKLISFENLHRRNVLVNYLGYSHVFTTKTKSEYQQNMKSTKKMRSHVSRKTVAGFLRGVDFMIGQKSWILAGNEQGNHELAAFLRSFSKKLEGFKRQRIEDPISEKRINNAIDWAMAQLTLPGLGDQFEILNRARNSENIKDYSIERIRQEWELYKALFHSNINKEAI